MIIHIVQEKDLPNFGYVEDGKEIPAGFHPWASLDTGDWSVTFPDGRTIRYGSFPELHQDLAEQRGEIGARVLEQDQGTGRIDLVCRSSSETPGRECLFPKLKPRWDVHSRGDEDWLGCASEALSSVRGEWSGAAG